MNKQSNKINRKIKMFSNFRHCSVKCINRYRTNRYRLFKFQNHKWGGGDQFTKRRDKNKKTTAINKSPGKTESKMIVH